VIEIFGIVENALLGFTQPFFKLVSATGA